MRKTYITPSIFAMELKAEQMLAVSNPKIKEGRTADDVDALTRRKGWCAEDFMPGYEDDYME